VPATNRLYCRCHCSHDQYNLRQRLGNGWLNDYVSSVAKCAVGLNSLTVWMDMPNLHNPCINKECTAQEAECHPQRVTCSRIEARPWHC
jgi:hypothetical protein